VNPMGEEYRIWVIHQAAGRYLRREIITYMKKTVKEFDDIEQDELIEKVEAAAVALEDLFVKSFEWPCFDYEKN
jgi:hypothetical protein